MEHEAWNRKQGAGSIRLAPADSRTAPSAAVPLLAAATDWLSDTALVPAAARLLRVWPILASTHPMR